MKLRATSRPQTHARVSVCVSACVCVCVCVCVCACECVIESESEHAWDSIIRQKVLTTLTLSTLKHTYTLPHMHQCTCRISFPLAYTHLFYMLKVAGIYTTAKKSSVTTKNIILILIPWWRNVLRMYIFTSNLMNSDFCIVVSGYVLDYNLLARQQDQDGCGGFLLKTKKKTFSAFLRRGLWHQQQTTSKRSDFQPGFLQFFIGYRMEML